MIVDLPPAPIAAKIKWSLRQPSQSVEGEFVSYRRVTILPEAARWSAEVEYPTMQGEQAIRPWRAAFALLRGRVNAFRLNAGEAAQEGVLVGAGTAPVVDGANQTGTTLRVRGFVGGSYLQAGDFVTVRERLYQVTAAFIFGSDGRGVIAIVPEIEARVPDAAPIEAVRPYGVMAMADDTTGWTVSPGRKYDIGFKCEEAF